MPLHNINSAVVSRKLHTVVLSLYQRWHCRIKGGLKTATEMTEYDEEKVWTEVEKSWKNPEDFKAKQKFKNPTQH